LEPWSGGTVQSVIAETGRMAADAQANGRFTGDDRAWLDDVATRALSVAQEIANTYVHVDYKLNNLTVAKDAGAWRVSGLFDLHEARFSDGAIDVVRTACSYLDTEPELARVFREAYGKPLDAARMPLYVLNDRMKFWTYFTQPSVDAEWLRGQTFRGWAQRYVDGVLALL
jgi:aminoglycoside/choline kinase family phosphotransferase